MSTKERIYQVSLALFNQYGLKNVRLQHIADTLKMSVGNLAYHYPSFEHLVKYVVKRSLEDLMSTTASWDHTYFFIDFDNRLTQYYFKMHKYAFYFVDSIEILRSYPALHEYRIELSQKALTELENWIIKNLRNDFLIFKEPSLSYDLAKSLRFSMEFYHLQNAVLENNTHFEHHFRKFIWFQIFPYFSDKGKSEFEIMIQPKLME